MSVVNKMLQDLEQRQQAEAGYSGDYQPSERGNRRWWWLGGALLMVLVLAIVAFSQGMKFGAANPSSPQSSAANQSAAANKKAAPNQSAAADQKAAPDHKAALNQQTAPDKAAQQPAAEAKTPVTEPAPEAETPVTEPAELDARQKLALAEADLAAESAAKANQANIADVPSQPETETKSAATFAISNNKAGDPGQLFRQQAQTALGKGDDKQAIVALENLLKLEPDNHIARKKIAALLFANGQDAQAKSVLQQGLQDDPGRVDIRQMLARLYVQQQQPEAAYSLLSEYPADALQDTDYVALRASLAQQLGKHGEARQDYQALVVAQPSNPQWWLGLAICEDKLGASSDALLAYRKANTLEQISPAVSEFIAQRIASLAGLR